MSLARLAALWGVDAWRCLRFERGAAPTPGQALAAWRQSVSLRWQRRRRMGTAAFIDLLQAEAACASVGLGYPREDAGQTAPWHLPERFLRLPAAELPPHPVIEPAVLAALALGQAAAPALMQLAQQGTASPQWLSLPLLAPGGLLKPHASGPATRARPARPARTARTAVCLHLFYPELWPLLHAQLRLIPEAWDLFISVPCFSATHAWQAITADQPNVRFLPVANRGRDVAPWLTLLRSGALDGYDAVCKLHGKRSPHMAGGGDAWRDAMVQALLGNGANVAAILARFRDDPRVGMIGPGLSSHRLGAANGWAKNRHNVELLAKRLGVDTVNPAARFFAGTMFWFRPSAMSAWKLVPALADFPIEMGQTEGTMAHAVERALVLGLSAQGLAALDWPASGPGN